MPDNRQYQEATDANLAGAYNQGSSNPSAVLNSLSSNPTAVEALRQLGITQDSLQPYITAGANSLGEMNTINGLGGDMTPIIRDITGSDYYNTQKGLNEDALLQNLSSKGMVRSGTAVKDMGDIAPTLINQLLQDRYKKLSDIYSLGQTAAAGMGTLAGNTGNIIDNSVLNRSKIDASNALQEGQNTANMWSTISGLGGLGSQIYNL